MGEELQARAVHLTWTSASLAILTAADSVAGAGSFEFQFT